ncbi:11139_t:CDS:10, partial [Funneliformis mosseae]
QKRHKYFDDNDVSNWSIYGFHEEWIRHNEDDPKKLRYQKANDTVTKSLRSLINDCEDDVKRQGGCETSSKQGKYVIMVESEKPTVCWSSECLLGGVATVVHARRNQLFADPPNACLDAWLVTMPICVLRKDQIYYTLLNAILEVNLDNLWAPIEYKNLEQLARTRLNCEQVDNVTRFSSALTGAAVKNLSNVIPESTSVIPSKRPFESPNSETASTGQETPEGARTPSSGSPPSKDISTPNKRDMHNEKVVRYLDAMGSSLNYNRVLSGAPPVWTKSIEMYLNNAFKKEGDEFKTAIMQKIEGDERNYFRLYCEKILIDFYNLVDIFPNMSRRIGERKYIVQNISSLFKYYETTFGNISFDWIESHSPAGKLTKSTTNSGIIKVDVRGVRLLDDKEIIHVEVSGPPSSPSERHSTDDTKKSLHTDILNLISILLDQLDLSVEVATRIKVYSFQVIEYRITLYSLNMMNDGSFLASELFSAIFPFSFDARAKYKQILLLMGIFHIVTNQISLMQELDLEINFHEGKSVRSVLKIPTALKELLQKKFDC